MALIVRHTITATTQADSSTSNVLRMYDQLGTEYTQVFYAPVEFNVADKVDRIINELNEQLAIAESEPLTGI